MSGRMLNSGFVSLLASNDMSVDMVLARALHHGS